MLPRVNKSIDPWLRKNIPDPRFWDEKFDKTHIGEIDLPTPTKKDREIFFERFKAMPDPLIGKNVVVIKV